jgi:predicted transcriptional regulator
MTLQLPDEEQEGLEACASYLGISAHDAARQAIREYIERFNNRARVSGASDLILSVHADAIERLGK